MVCKPRLQFTQVRLVTSSALQSRKWQLIGTSQWCRSALCGHPLPELTDNWTHGAASRHTVAAISHTRPSSEVVILRHQRKTPLNRFTGNDNRSTTFEDGSETVSSRRRKLTNLIRTGAVRRSISPGPGVGVGDGALFRVSCGRWVSIQSSNGTARSRIGEQESFRFIEHVQH